MRSRCRPLCQSMPPSICLALAILISPTLAESAEPIDYLRQVKPLLQQRCYACHGALQQKSGLRLDTARSLLKGSGSGTVIVAGRPAESRLIELVTSTDDDRMPPPDQGTPLNAE